MDKTLLSNAYTNVKFPLSFRVYGPSSHSSPTKKPVTKPTPAPILALNPNYRKYNGDNAAVYAAAQQAAGAVTANSIVRNPYTQLIMYSYNDTEKDVLRSCSPQRL